MVGSFDLKAIKWVLNVSGGKALLDGSKVRFVAEAKMVDCERVVERFSLHFESLNNISKGVRTDVEVSWHSVKLDVAFKATALVVLELQGCAIPKIFPANILLFPSLNT
jgi:hypothetical protein